MLRKKELKRIQDDIARTIRPSWQTSLPRDFGAPSHGKPKADEWRTGIDFDLPVSIVKLWLEIYNSSSESREKDVIDATMFLAMAIRIGTSHQTSSEHAEKYRAYIHAYLQILLRLYPNKQLRPIHHNALHLADFLLLFGPCHGWWMFPFERLIGTLQKVNTNGRMGRWPDNKFKRALKCSFIR
jgi:hypothetical protein